MGRSGWRFFHHLGGGNPADSHKVGFIERRGSPHGITLRGKGALKITAAGVVAGIRTADVCHPDLVTSAGLGWLPEVVPGCTRPDQLLATISEYVALLEWLCSVHGIEGAARRLAVLFLPSNAIYHERVRRFLVELLEESMLYGRLPGLRAAP